MGAWFLAIGAIVGVFMLAFASVYVGVCRLITDTTEGVPL